MKGVIYVWFVVLAVIFITGFLWIIFSEIYVTNIFPMARAHLAAYPNSSATLDYIEAVWNYWPIILMFGMIFYAFVASQKKEPDTYSYF